MEVKSCIYIATLIILPGSSLDHKFLCTMYFNADKKTLGQSMFLVFYLPFTKNLTRSKFQ